MPVANPPSIHLLDLTPESLRAWLQQHPECAAPAYRADQILAWVYDKATFAFESMSNLPAGFRGQLAAAARVLDGTLLREQQAADGTLKLLLGWTRGGTSETVIIPSHQRMTACISTQVGCPVGCSFCASGIGGLQRNLTGGEIVEQALRAAVRCATLGERLSNVVFMGLGEPLANYDATLHALRTINAPWGLGISARKITVSTVGLPSQMVRLAKEKLPITLALSVHAPTDELRRQLIPWAQRVTLEALTTACRTYFEHTGREVTLEYILLAGVNDQPAHADALAALCRRMRSNVNLIAYNPVADLGFRRPSDRAVGLFEDRLRSMGVNAHVRTPRGLDIDAACGQLRRRHEPGTPATAPLQAGNPLPAARPVAPAPRPDSPSPADDRQPGTLNHPK